MTAPNAQDTKLTEYISHLEKQLHFTKTDLDNRPKLYEMLVKSASHGAGAENLKQLLKTPNNVLSNEDLRRKIELIEKEILEKTNEVPKIS
jgi:hypothetical protein